MLARQCLDTIERRPRAAPHPLCRRTAVAPDGPAENLASTDGFGTRVCRCSAAYCTVLPLVATGKMARPASRRLYRSQGLARTAGSLPARRLCTARQPCLKIVLVPSPDPGLNFVGPWIDTESYHSPQAIHLLAPALRGGGFASTGDERSCVSSWVTDAAFQPRATSLSVKTGTGEPVALLGDEADQLGESGTRKIRYPSISGILSDPFRNTKPKIAAGTSSRSRRSTAFSRFSDI